MSLIVTAGKREPQRFPSGAIDDGPVDPWHPPITLGQTTKYLSVSKGNPGPTIDGHQPGTSDQPVIAWLTKIALFFAAFKVPHVW
jgi:hypothetical protein